MHTRIDFLYRASRSIGVRGATIALLTILYLALMAGQAEAVPNISFIYAIKDDPKGGDCSQIGSWNPQTKTCKLNKSVSIEGMHGILLASDNITLDGNFNKVFLKADVTGAGEGDYLSVAISTGDEQGDVLTPRHKVTIRNVIISFVKDPDAMEVISGIYAKGSSNIVEGNSVTGDGHGSGILFVGNGGVIRKNTISQTRFGLSIEDYLPGGYADGASPESYFNVVYRNNFLNNEIQAAYGDMGLPVPLTKFTHATLGGNYWSNFDTAAEGCIDSNHNLKCDSPYLGGPEGTGFIFDNFVDTEPWTAKNGWNILSLRDANGHAVMKIPDKLLPPPLTKQPGFPFPEVR